MIPNDLYYYIYICRLKCERLILIKKYEKLPWYKKCFSYNPIYNYNPPWPPPIFGEDLIYAENKLKHLKRQLKLYNV